MSSAEPQAWQRRRDVIAAGHRGDVVAARAGMTDADSSVRAAAVGALGRIGAVTVAELEAALVDDAPEVRQRALPLAVARRGIDLAPLLADADPAIVETAAWALGERGDEAGVAVAELAAVAKDHPDPLCREAAVAALGAIGDPRGLEAILGGLSDKPAIRRRAVVALAPFDGPAVEGALTNALGDRDWQVRQAAEELGATSRPSP